MRESTRHTVTVHTVNLLHNLFLIPVYPKTATKLQRQLPIGNDMNKIIARHHHPTFVTGASLYSEMTSTNRVSLDLIHYTKRSEKYQYPSQKLQG